MTASAFSPGIHLQKKPHAQYISGIVHSVNADCGLTSKFDLRIAHEPRYFGRGKFRGRNFVSQIGAKPPPPKFFCAIRAISCSLGRLLTFFFCREVPGPMYCMSGSVFMLVRIPKFFSYVSCVPQKMILCTQCVSHQIFLWIRCVPQGLCSPQLYTRQQNLGVPKFFPPGNPRPSVVFSLRVPVGE